VLKQYLNRIEDGFPPFALFCGAEGKEKNMRNEHREEREEKRRARDVIGRGRGGMR
jgi:hypothetical protein